MKPLFIQVQQVRQIIQSWVSCRCRQISPSVSKTCLFRPFSLSLSLKGTHLFPFALNTIPPPGSGRIRILGLDSGRFLDGLFGPELGSLVNNGHLLGVAGDVQGGMQGGISAADYRWPWLFSWPETPGRRNGRNSRCPGPGIPFLRGHPY